MNRIGFFYMLLAFTALLAGPQPLAAQPPQQQWQVAAHLGDPRFGLAATTFIDSLHGFTAFRSDSIYYTTDGGRSWGASRSSTPFLVYGFAIADTLNGYCMGNDGPLEGTGVLLSTNDGGRSWQTRLERIGEPFHGIALAGLRTLILTGRVHHVPVTGSDSALIYRSTDGGGSWSRTTPLATYPLERCFFADSLNGWVLTGWGGDTSLILHTTDAGLSWQRQITPNGFQAFSASDRLHCWGAVEGAIYSSHDGGWHWELPSTIDPAIGYGPGDLVFVDSLEGWAAGGGFYRGYSTDVIYHSTDGGKTWQLEEVDLAGAGLRQLSMPDARHGFAVGYTSAVLAYRPIVNGIEENHTHNAWEDTRPNEPLLFQNYPNPFNSSTMIEYALAERSTVRLEIVNLLGQQVTTLVPGTLEDAGLHRVSFRADALPSGIYFQRLTLAGKTLRTRPMLLIR